MSRPLAERVPFAKILIGLVVVFLLSLGMCGVTLVFSVQGGNRRSAAARLLTQAFGVEVVGMVLAAAGILVISIVWVVAVVVGSSSKKVSQSQNQMNDPNDRRLD